MPKSTFYNSCPSTTSRISITASRVTWHSLDKDTVAQQFFNLAANLCQTFLMCLNMNLLWEVWSCWPKCQSYSSVTADVCFSGAKKKPYLTSEQFVKFLNNEQRDPRLNEILYPYFTQKQALDLINMYETKPSMAAKGRAMFFVRHSYCMIWMVGLWVCTSVYLDLNQRPRKSIKETTHYFLHLPNWHYSKNIFVPWNVSKNLYKFCCFICCLLLSSLVQNIYALS